jgi:signal transduction histidine kinase
MELVTARPIPEIEVETDVDAVDQILFNLVDNACKYAQDSDPARIVVSLQAAANEVTIAVQDFGPGVPPEHLSRIFAPFERGARTAGDNAYPGVGLGLALSRGLAEDLGAGLTYESSSRGARFVLKLRLD